MLNERFGRVPASWAPVLQELSRGELLVAVTITTHVNGKAESCCLKIRTLALETGLSPRYVKKVLKRLEDRKLIRLESQQSRPSIIHLATPPMVLPIPEGDGVAEIDAEDTTRAIADEEPAPSTFKIEDLQRGELQRTPPADSEAQGVNSRDHPSGNSRGHPRGELQRTPLAVGSPYGGDYSPNRVLEQSLEQTRASSDAPTAVPLARPEKDTRPRTLSDDELNELREG